MVLYDVLFEFTIGNNEVLSYFHIFPYHNLSKTFGWWLV